MRNRLIFWTWLPLAISFTFMMLEGPVVQSSVARLPEAALNLAAVGLALSLSITIESPIIMLLSTSIALARDGHSYRVLRNFTLVLLVALTLLTALVAFTPLYGIVTEGWLGVPAPIAAAAHPAFQLMLFWSAAIGWRRFLQGLLVRSNRIRMLSVGTAIRLATITALGFALVAFPRLPGNIAGALILICGVCAEMVATTIFARPVVRALPRADEPTPTPLSYGQVLRFHTPLAGASLLTLLVMPLTAAALARLDNPAVSLAAWPAVFSLQLVLRGVGLVMQEVTVALAGREEARVALRRFTLVVTAGVTAVAALLSFTPLLDLYIYGLIGLPREIGLAVAQGMRLSLFVPGFTALLSWLRGVLVARRATGDVNMAMGLNLLVLVLALIAGVAFGAPGIPLAALALTLALAVETAYLYWRAAAPLIGTHAPVSERVPRAP
jgi:progressive ankylosis protein